MNPPSRRQDLLPILASLAGADPASLDAVQLTTSLRDALLRIGSQTEDNVAAVAQIEVGAVRVTGSPEYERLALRIAGTAVSLADLLWAVEDGPVPESVGRAYPELTAAQWSAAMRVVVLLFTTLESDRREGQSGPDAAVPSRRGG